MKTEGRNLEVSVENDIKLDNGVKLKMGPLKSSRKITGVLLISDLWKLN